MSYLNRYLSFQTRQEQEQQQKSQANKKEQEQEQKIYSTAVWISGGKRPTLYIPNGLAKKYRMDKRCRVTFFDKDNGILIRYND